MSQVGESSFAPPSEVEEKEEEVKKVKVRISLFFDGTLNNRINIDQRIEEENNPGTNAIYQKYKGDDNSYEGDYTNVSKMEKYIDDAAGYDYTLSVYTEGPGTEDKKKDQLRGYAFGTGDTGVTEKVKSGIKKAVERISKSVKSKSTVIELLTIDVFGFSRGAAGARNCIYEVLGTGKKPIKQRIQDEGYKLTKVEVCFAGLYDTVSSHGLSFSNDVSALKLNAVANAKKVVQLAAADEHRKNFSLTDIMSAGKSNGLQLFLPGAHSDIGGGYRAPVAGKLSEDEKPIFQSLSLQTTEAEKKRLIDSGWYNDNELNIVAHALRGHRKRYVIEVTRASISNEYSKIPLHLMAKYAKESGITLKGKLSRDESVPAKLKSVESNIHQYVGSCGTRSSSGDWDKNDGWLKTLRHDHLHFSAYLSFAHGPRIEGGVRVRKIYHG